MSQDGVGVDLETSLGYLLKEASSVLRAAMEEALRPLGMSVTHYACLELLAQRPGLSNSELARGAFVTRQSMNVLLQALERGGYVTRPAEAPVGNAGRHDRDRAVRRVPDPAEDGPFPARWQQRCIARGPVHASSRPDRSAVEGENSCGRLRKPTDPDYTLCSDEPVLARVVSRVSARVVVPVAQPPQEIWIVVGSDDAGLGPVRL
jgi:MarR family